MSERRPQIAVVVWPGSNDDREAAWALHALRADPVLVWHGERELPEPIFTPATKAQSGHDENIDAEQASELIGRERFREVERVALTLYEYAAKYARERGIVIADTKFEFGLDDEGRLVLGDEALTPDSSRFWPADEYAPGGAQPSFDKQYVRDYCETLGWDKTPPGPELPGEVVDGTRARYVDAFERITGISFADYLADPDVVLR